METFTFEFANGISPDTERKELSLDAVLNMLQNPGSIKAERSYIPGTLKNHRRATSNVESRSMLTLDLDGALDGGKEALEEYLKPYVYLWHTTFSHTPEDPHYRYLIPLATEVSAEDYRRIIDHIMSKTMKRLSTRPAPSPPRLCLRQQRNTRSTTSSGRIWSANTSSCGVVTTTLPPTKPR